MSKKHIQLPNGMTENKKLTPKDLLVYLAIKKYMNNESKSCYPSINTIVKDSGVSKMTVMKCLDKLEKEQYIKIVKNGMKRNNVYIFLSYKNFEVFSEEFLETQDIDINEKSYVIASQHTMFKDIEGFGKISYSDTELSKIINMDRHSIAKYNKSLEEKGFLTVVPTNKVDPSTGIKINEKFFHLNELGQAIIWTLQKHDDDIKTVKEKINKNSKDMSLLLKQIKELKDSNQEQKQLTQALIEKYNITTQDLESLTNNEEVTL